MSTVNTDYRAGLLDASALLAAYMTHDTEGCSCIINAQTTANGLVWGLVQIAGWQILERAVLSGVDLRDYLATLHRSVMTVAGNLIGPAS